MLKILAENFHPEKRTFLNKYFVSVDKLKLLSFHGKILQDVQIWYKAITKSESQFHQIFNSLKSSLIPF